MYSSGFIVDNGPIRLLLNPSNREFFVPWPSRTFVESSSRKDNAWKFMAYNHPLFKRGREELCRCIQLSHIPVIQLHSFFIHFCIHSFTGAQLLRRKLVCCIYNTFYSTLLLDCQSSYGHGKKTRLAYLRGICRAVMLVLEPDRTSRESRRRNVNPPGPKAPTCTLHLYLHVPWHINIYFQMLCGTDPYPTGGILHMYFKK